MSMFDDLKNKAEEFVKDNPDKVESVSDSVLDKVADLADDKTGGRYHDQVEGAQAKADDAIGE